MRDFHSVPCQYVACRRMNMSDDGMCSDACRKLAADATALARAAAEGVAQTPSAISLPDQYVTDRDAPASPIGTPQGGGFRG